MAVVFYAEGEHPAGFIGFRVATTLGDAKDFKQQYFALSEYDYEEAYNKAHALNNQWRAYATTVRRTQRLKETSDRGNPGYIATGLRGALLVEHKGKRETPLIRPCFVAQVPGYGNGQVAIPIIKHGYVKAYIMAVDRYAIFNNLSDEETATLISRIPKKTMFTQDLWKQLISKGIFVSKASIMEKIG